MTVRHAYVHGSPDGADETLMRASDWNADHVVDVFAPTGLTGAVTAARFVGGTTSGAPVTGTFAAGDYVVAQDGKLWACSSAGSPGTWAQIGGASDVAMLASGSGSSRLPGIEVADRAPASPSAYDDEFDGGLSTWTTMGSPDILNTSDIPSNVHMRVNSSAYQLDGIYKAMPTPPFTMTVKFSDYRFVSQYNAYTIGVGHSDGNNPWWVFGNAQVNDYGLRTDWFTALWSNRTTRSAVADTNTGGYMQRYMRMIVTSATDIVCQRSHGGLVWVTSRTSTNPTFTPTKIGIFMTGYTSIPVEASIDWIRFSS